MFNTAETYSVIEFIIGQTSIGKEFPLKEYVQKYIEEKKNEGNEKYQDIFGISYIDKIQEIDYDQIATNLVAGDLVRFIVKKKNEKTGQEDWYYTLRKRAKKMKRLDLRTYHNLLAREEYESRVKIFKEMAPILISSIALAFSSASTIYSVRSYNLAVKNSKKPQIDNMRIQTEQVQSMQIELNKRISYSCIDSFWKKFHPKKPKIK